MEKYNYILNCQKNKLFIKETKEGMTIKTESMQTFFNRIKKNANLSI